MSSNGFKLKALNQDCNRIAVKSNVQTSWNPTYKKHIFSRGEEYDIAMTRDEIIVISFQDGSGHAEIEIKPLGDKAGTLIAQSSRNATKTLRVGAAYRFELQPGESIIMRGTMIVHPRHMGAGLSV
jgi:hypothetical protein